MIQNGTNHIKKMFRLPSPQQVRVTYVSKGYDLGIGPHSRYTCDGHEIDMICSDGRDAPKLIVARLPDSKRRYVGFDYNLNTGQCNFYDYGISEKEIQKMIGPMDKLIENSW